MNDTILCYIGQCCLKFSVTALRNQQQTKFSKQYSFTVWTLLFVTAGYRTRTAQLPDSPPPPAGARAALFVSNRLSDANRRVESGSVQVGTAARLPAAALRRPPNRRASYRWCCNLRPIALPGHPSAGGNIFDIYIYINIYTLLFNNIHEVSLAH